MIDVWGRVLPAYAPTAYIQGDYMLKQSAILARGVIAVDAGTGSTYIIHSSKKPVGWWEYLYTNQPLITPFIIKYGEKEGTVLRYSSGMLTFNEEEIREALLAVWEDCPDDVADVKHQDCLAMSVIHRLVFGEF